MKNVLHVSIYTDSNMISVVLLSNYAESGSHLIPRSQRPDYSGSDRSEGHVT